MNHVKNVYWEKFCPRKLNKSSGKKLVLNVKKYKEGKKAMKKYSKKL